MGVCTYIMGGFLGEIKELKKKASKTEGKNIELNRMCTLGSIKAACKCWINK